MIVLVPMDAAEFTTYIERAVPDFARDKIDSGQWSGETALQLARRGFDELLPQGLATAGNFFFTLRAVDGLADVGMLWFAVQDRAGQPIAYVYDIRVEQAYRRRGIGTSAFEALESEVASRGLHGIGLHVFGHNEAARALYARLGYRTTNINMFKTVPSARI